jgi:hypothetical protein
MQQLMKLKRHNATDNRQLQLTESSLRICKGGRPRLPLPITIYATKQEVEQQQDRWDIINITEIGESQAMMEMDRHEYIGNLQHVSTDILNAHGPGVLVPTTQFRQQCSSFEQPYD